MTDRWLPAIVWGLAAFAGLLCVYWPVFQAGFIWNDADYVTHPTLRDVDGLWRIWTEPGATEQYYPLLHSAFWLQCAIWGDRALGFHAANLGFHGIAAVLFYTFLTELRVKGAHVAAALFAFHPVCVESVAWISEQKNTLSLALALAAACVYLRFERTRRTSTYVCASGLFVAALLSKSVTATVPGALLVIAWWGHGTVDAKRDVLPLLPWLAFGAAFGAFTAWVERVHVGASGADFALTWLERLALAGRIPWFYVGKLAWPAEIMFIYPRWVVDVRSLATWLLPALTVVTLAGAWFLRHKARGVLTTVLLFGGLLFPMLGLFPVYGMKFSFVADHWVYHASLAFFALAGYGLHRALSPLHGPITVLASVALLAALGIKSHQLAGTYRTSDGFYEHLLQLNPNAWMAHNNLGTARLHAGNYGAAERHLSEAVRLKPDYFEAWNNLGLAVDAQGRSADAAAHFRRAIVLNPGYGAAHLNFGNVLFAANRYTEAEAEYRAALRLDATLHRARYNLGVTLAAQGRTREAMQEYERVLATDPYSTDARFNLAAALSETGNPGSAAEHYRLLLAQAPSADVHNNLGNALLATGDLLSAEEQFRRAIALAPTLLPARANLVRVLQRAGNAEEARRQAEILRRLQGR